VHLSLFCTVTNKCTIISQIITPLHVSTLSCHPQGACNQYLAKLHKYFKRPINTQLSHKLSHSYMFRHSRVILRELVTNTLPSYTSIFCTMTNKCTIISQIITPLHVSTLSCHSQTACNQHLAKLHKYILYYDQQMHNYFTNYHTATCFDTIVSFSDSL